MTLGQRDAQDVPRYQPGDQADATTELPAVGSSGEAAGSPEVGRHQRRRAWWVRALVIVGVLTLVCAGSALVGAWLLSNRYEDKVQRADILRDVPKPPPPAVDLSPMNFLVLGSDSRSPDARGFDATGDRSDTIMIVHIPQGRASAFVFSIPRDSYVYVPPAGDWPGGMNKINAAMSFGGAAHAARTVYELTKIPLDGAFIMNFGAVERMVGVVGKVHVCIPYDVYDTFNDRTWVQGCHDFDPETTRYFMQMRMGVPGGDFGRIYNQQLVVKALASQIAGSGMLSNPVKLDQLISIVAESVTIDQDTDLRRLILDLKDIRPDSIAFATAPWARTMTTDAGSLVELDAAASQELFQAVIDDRTGEWLDAHPQGVPEPFGS